MKWYTPFSLFPWQKVSYDIPFLFVRSSAFLFLFVNKDNISKFLFDDLGYLKNISQIFFNILKKDGKKTGKIIYQA